MNFKESPLRDRSVLNRSIRSYFDSQGFLEVDSPILSPVPIPESHIELFRSDRLLQDGSFSPLYLLPSPELWLKQLLAKGSPSLYQIGKCFRNGEQLDRWHRLEFTMLEWYALQASAEDNIETTRELLEVCTSALNLEKDTSVSGDIRRMSMEEVFSDFAGFSLETDLRNAGLAECRPSDEGYSSALERVRTTLASRLQEKGLPFGNEDLESADDLFHRLFLTLVEDELPADRPLALTHWPQLVPTLARRITETPWAERWELYIRGVEVANCYGEETDRKALETYWNTESRLKEDSLVPVPHEDYIAGKWIDEVSGSMPDCSGVAIGLDRLLALIRGDDSLEGLDLFPIHDIIRR